MTKAEIYQLLNEFNALKCHIYDPNGKLESEGTFSLNIAKGYYNDIDNKIFATQNDNIIDSIIINIKNIDKDLSNGNYIIEIISRFKADKYYKIKITEGEWQSYGSILSKKINTNELKIDEVTENDFNSFNAIKYDFDWSNIRTDSSTTGNEKEDAFEDLCIELLGKWEVKDLKRIGKGADRGRDASYYFNDSKIPLIGATSSWVVQCKYSVNYTSLEIEDIYKEMIKVIMHKPDHYLIMTNRKIKNDFLDWITNDIFKTTDYFIPFKVHLIQKEQLEAELSKPENRYLRQKYFK